MSASRSDAARGQAPGAPPEEVWPAYEGAVLVNANGSMVGQVRSIESGADGPVVILRIGGANDVLGFMEFGGTDITVPAERVLWGPRRSVGSVFAAVPVETSDAEEITAALG